MFISDGIDKALLTQHCPEDTSTLNWASLKGIRHELRDTNLQRIAMDTVEPHDSETVQVNPHLRHIHEICGTISDKRCLS